MGRQRSRPRISEAETRAEHIEPALRAAGWGGVEGSRIFREYSITLGRLEGAGRRARPLIADYVLVYRNTKLAVIEAKAWNEQPTKGVAQAKSYAEKLAIRFAHSTNGETLYRIYRQTGTEGELSRYPTPDELWNLTFSEANAWRDRFAAIPFEDKGGYFQGRYYQDIAIQRVLEAVAACRDRILLTLATGTGKTFIAFQIAWRLFYSRWPRCKSSSKLKTATSTMSSPTSLTPYPLSQDKSAPPVLKPTSSPLSTPSRGRSSNLCWPSM